jgi:hypothetical protein
MFLDHRIDLKSFTMWQVLVLAGVMGVGMAPWITGATEMIRQKLSAIVGRSLLFSRKSLKAIS